MAYNLMPRSHRLPRRLGRDRGKAPRRARVADRAGGGGKATHLLDLDSTPPSSLHSVAARLIQSAARGYLARKTLVRCPICYGMALTGDSVAECSHLLCPKCCVLITRQFGRCPICCRPAAGRSNQPSDGDLARPTGSAQDAEDGHPDSLRMRARLLSDVDGSRRPARRAAALAQADERGRSRSDPFTSRVAPRLALGALTAPLSPDPPRRPSFGGGGILSFLSQWMSPSASTSSNPFSLESSSPMSSTPRSGTRRAFPSSLADTAVLVYDEQPWFRPWPGTHVTAELFYHRWPDDLGPSRIGVRV